MKNKNGFATSGILYTLLLLFVALLFGVLQNLQNKKTILDRLKIDTVQALSCDCVKIGQDILDLQNQISTIQNLGKIYATEEKTVNVDIAKNYERTEITSLSLEKGSYVIQLKAMVQTLNSSEFATITASDSSNPDLFSINNNAPNGYLLFNNSFIYTTPVATTISLKIIRWSGLVGSQTVIGRIQAMKISS